MAFIEAYVTNLGKYNEGELASEPLKFPTTTEEVQALLKRIGVDNIQYEEIFIADYGGDRSWPCWTSGKRNSRPNWQSRRRKTSSTSDRAPLLDTLSRGTRPALGMGSAVIYPPSPGFMLHSREWAVKGRNARRILRWPALYGLPRLCYFPGKRRGYILQSRPLSLDRERAGG